MTSLFAVQFAMLLRGPWKLNPDEVPVICSTLMALTIIVVILCMPLRDLALPHKQISPVFTQPKHEFRSPEDSLTPWQFMCVSWMQPLITMGSSRQLNEDDVWSLSYEFQHKYLHDRFREMKGSVVRRLLAANGLDVVIIVVLGILESLASVHYAS